MPSLPTPRWNLQLPSQRDEVVLPRREGLWSSPPRGFCPAGQVDWAVLTKDPWEGSRAGRMTVAQKRGLRFQAEVGRKLAGLLGGQVDVQIQPWFAYTSRGSIRRRFCSPDLLVTSGSQTLIIEVKYSLCAEAYWQLVHLYHPVVKMWLGRPSGLCVLARLVDPSVALPCSWGQTSLSGLTELGAFDPLKPFLSVVRWPI
jgi:hypothetical protein